MEFAHESSIALLKILLDIGHVFPCSLDTSLPALVCLPLWLSTLSLNRLPCPSLSGRPACIYAVCFPPPVPIRVCTQRHVCNVELSVPGCWSLHLCLLLAVSLCLISWLIIHVPILSPTIDYSCISILLLRREIESSCQCSHHLVQKPTKVDNSRLQQLWPQQNSEDSDQGITSPKQGRQTGCERGSVPYRYSNHTGSIPLFTYFLMALERFCLCS